MYCVGRTCGVGSEWFSENVSLASRVCGRSRTDCKVKVKCSRYRPGVAQRVGRGIDVLFHDRGTRRG